jgi:hypothetical protein
MLEKLDRNLMSREWEILFPTVHGHKELRNMYDHNPLILSTQLINSCKKRDFKFELIVGDAGRRSMEIPTAKLTLAYGS